MTMSDEEAKRAFVQVKRYKVAGVFAPHKPLLLMLMLGHYWNNGRRLVLFRDIVMPLSGLLYKFAKVEDNYPAARTLLPFVSMQSSKEIWERTHPDIGKNEYHKAFMTGMRGGFTSALYRRVINDKSFLLELALLVHEKHIRDMRLEDLLREVNIPNRDILKQGDLISETDSMDLGPEENSCSVCGYSGLAFKKPAGLRSVHVKWPVAGGPANDPDNLLVMCELHKNLFDCGIITINPKNWLVKVSKHYHVSFEKDGPSSIDWSKEKIQIAQHKINSSYLQWHNDNVFHS